MTHTDHQFSAGDHAYMQRAIELASCGRFTTTPNPNVGCIIVQGDTARYDPKQIVGEGFHQVAGQGHAEVNALAAAGGKAAGATAYVTLEPCSHFGRTPPCAEALIKAGVSRVVSAMVDPNPQVAGRGLRMLQQQGIAVQSGLLEDAAKALNPGFLKRMLTGRPFITLKLASSLDGRTALANGESQWITGPAARRDVQGFRAQSCAILSTATTVIRDNAALNVREQELPEHIRQQYPVAHIRQPTRIILDRRGALHPELRLFQQGGDVILVSESPLTEGPWQDNWVLPFDESGVDLDALSLRMGQAQFNHIWTEAGAGLAGSLLSANLIDQFILYQAPKFMGADARGLLDLFGLEQMSQAPLLTIQSVEIIGSDIRIIACPPESP